MLHFNDRRIGIGVMIGSILLYTRGAHSSSGRIDFQRINVAGLHVTVHRHTGIFQRSDIERFTNAGLAQQVRTNQIMRIHIGNDPAIIQHDDAGDIAV